MKALRVVLALVVLFAVPLASAQQPTLAVAEQVHVSLGEEPGTLVVHWALVGQEYVGPETPGVAWSVQGQALTFTAGSKVGTVQPGGNAVSQGTAVKTHVYAATLGPFEPETVVSYRAGAPQRGYTNEFQVSVPPSANSSMRFVAYGDIGYDGLNEDGTQDATDEPSPPLGIMARALRADPDLFIIPGDMAYVNTRVGWDRYMRGLQPLQATVPVMPTVGNHEYEPDANLGYRQYLNNWALPGNEMDFAFKAGPVTFVALNSDGVCQNEYRTSYGTPARPCDDGKNGSPNETQMQWMEQVFADAAGDETAWTIAYFHHPPFSHGRHGNDWGLQALWTPIFERHGVDLVITAHDHLYSRSYPIVERNPVVTQGNNYTAGQGVVYAVIGGGGRALYDLPEGDPPAWHAHGEKIHHLGIIDVTPDELRFQAMRIDGSVMDEFTIVRSATESPGGGTGAGGASPSLVGATLLFALVMGTLWRRRTV